MAAARNNCACSLQDEGALRRIGSRVAATQDEIAFERVTVVTPANTVLVRDLSVRVPAGTNLLVTGPNGSGKSSLFRVLGGLWPAESGVVRKPDASEAGLSHNIFYVPQRPYVTKGALYRAPATLHRCTPRSRCVHTPSSCSAPLRQRPPPDALLLQERCWSS
jgi:ABC-type uncharacterized transport system fused permease/ATPase subunit